MSFPAARHLSALFRDGAADGRIFGILSTLEAYNLHLLFQDISYHILFCSFVRKKQLVESFQLKATENPAKNPKEIYISSPKRLEIFIRNFQGCLIWQVSHDQVLTQLPPSMPSMSSVLMAVSCLQCPRYCIGTFDSGKETKNLSALTFPFKTDENIR